MNELKPVAWMHVQGDYNEPRLWRIAEDMAERGWGEKPLYEIPDTHRVVSVELLKGAVDMIWGLCDEDTDAVKELCAIIDNKEAT